MNGWGCRSGDVGDMGAVVWLSSVGMRGGDQTDGQGCHSGFVDALAWLLRVGVRGGDQMNERGL